MKLFYAVDIPDKAIKRMIKETSKLREEYPQFAWVPKDNFHITLHYLGELHSDKIDKIREKTERAIFDIEPTNLYAFGLDIFISTKIVIYISFHKNKVVETLSSRLSAIHTPQEKRTFIPHLTIARWKVPSKQQYLHLKKKLHRTEITLEFPINKVHLYESIARPKFPLYKKVHTFELQRQS